MTSNISKKSDSKNNQLSINPNNRCICKVKCDNGQLINGFLCVIPFINVHNFLPVLIINNDILSHNEGTKIYFTLNKDSTFYEIIICSSRKIFTSKKFNITFIEILEKDQININSFLYVDEELFNILDNFQDMPIYLINYEPNENSEKTNGNVITINERNDSFEFYCDHQLINSGCPILRLNNKIIGIYKSQNHQDKNIYNGLLLKEPIEIFFNNEFNKTFENLNDDILESLDESLNEENIVPIIPKFKNTVNISDYDKYANNNFLNELNKKMEQQHISYSFLNDLNEPLFKAIKDAKKKYLIKEFNTQINFTLPKVLVISKKKYLLKKIKFYRDAYEKEANNINRIIYSINKLNTNLLQPLEIIKDYFKNEENNYKKNIKQKLKNEPYTKENKGEKKPYKNQINFIYKNIIQNKILSNNIYFFFNSFGEFIDLIKRIKCDITNGFVFFQKSLKEFEDIENTQKINNGMKSIKDSFFKIIELIDKKTLKNKEKEDRNNNLDLDETILSKCKNIIEKATIIKVKLQSEKFKDNLNKINFQDIEKNIIQIKERVEEAINITEKIVTNSETSIY